MFLANRLNMLKIQNFQFNISIQLAPLNASAYFSGPIQDRIETSLKNKLEPSILQVHNESSTHNVPKGSETHFRVVIVSEHFQGMNALNRHRKVVQVLKEEFANIHALAIEAYTPVQWENDLNGKSDLRSPRCLGGSKTESTKNS